MLPSSLTRVLPRALEFSSRLPVSVCGTGTFAWLEAFLGSVSTGPSGTIISPPHHSLKYMMCGFACTSFLRLRQALPSACVLPLLRHPIARNGFWWYRNFHLLSFDYAFRPRLRARLTLSGRTFLRKPWAFGGQDSHLSFRYSYRHSHFQSLQLSLRSTFNADWNAPLPPGTS